MAPVPMFAGFARAAEPLPGTTKWGRGMGGITMSKATSPSVGAFEPSPASLRRSQASAFESAREYVRSRRLAISILASLSGTSLRASARRSFSEQNDLRCLVYCWIAS